MNDAVFFAEIRQSLFRGRLSRTQADGINAILAGWRKMGDGDRRKLAYVLATSYHETARTMQPIEEYGRGQGRRYGAADPKTGRRYYGRGHVQLTWKRNYQKMAEITGVPLVAQPQLALDPDISVEILISGMMGGVFTGRKLADFIGHDGADYVNARRIVNGTDRAGLIAGYAAEFEAALRAAALAPPVPDHVTSPHAPPTTGKPMAQSTTVWSAGAGALATIATAIAGLAEKSPWLAGFVILVASVCAVWIIKERFHKARRHGI